MADITLQKPITNFGSGTYAAKTARGFTFKATPADITIGPFDGPISVVGAKTVVVNDLAYVLGGAQNSLMYIFDQANETWEAREGKAGLFPVVFAVGTDIHMISGVKHYVYSTTTKTWLTNKLDTPINMDGATVTSIGTNVYIMNPDASTQSIYVYVPSTDTWTKKTDIPGYVKRAAAFTNGTNVYLCGGYTSSTLTDFTTSTNILMYNVSTNAWGTLTTKMNKGRADHEVVEVQGTKYIIGGINKAATMEPSVEVIQDITISVIDVLDSVIPNGRVSATAFGVKNKLHYYGGSTTTGANRTGTEANMLNDHNVVVIAGPNNLKIYYTTDGTEPLDASGVPTATAKLYTTATDIPIPSNVKAKVKYVEI